MCITCTMCTSHSQPAQRNEVLPSFYSLLSHSASCKKVVAEVESRQVWSDRNFSLQEVVLRHVGKCIYELCCLSPPWLLGFFCCCWGCSLFLCLFNSGISIKMRSSFWMTLCRWVEHHLIVVFVFTCILLLYHHPWTSYSPNSGLSAADVHLGTNIYITVYVVWFMYTVYTVLLLCRNT